MHLTDGKAIKHASNSSSAGNLYLSVTSLGSKMPHYIRWLMKSALLNGMMTDNCFIEQIGYAQIVQ
jgi:hypothetical protein